MMGVHTHVSVKYDNGVWKGKGVGNKFFIFCFDEYGAIL